MSTQDTGNAPQQPETATDKPLENKAEAPATPEVNAGESEVEKLRKQLQKEQMEKNLLRNKLDETEKEREERERKELEEKEEYRKLYEQSNEQLQQIEKEREEADKAAKLEAQADKVFDEFPEEVQAVAKEAGLELKDLTPEAQEDLKKRLENISKRVSSAKVGPNNPGSTPAQGRGELIENYQLNRNDPKAWNDLAMSVPSVRKIVEEARREG